MRKVLFAVIVLIAVAFGFKAGGWGGVTISGLLPNLENLNSELTRINQTYVNGTDEIGFSAPEFMIGGHGYGQIGQIIVGGGGSGLGVREKGDSLSARLNYGMGYAEAGFQIEPLRWLWIRPSITLAGSGFEIELNEFYGDFGDPPEDTLYSPYRYVASAGSFNAGAALALEFNLPISGATFIGLELKGGYLYPLFKTDWYNEDGLVVNEVEGFGIFGLFFEASVNFGRSGELDASWEQDDDWEDY